MNRGCVAVKSIVYKLAYKDIVVHRTLIMTYLVVLLALALRIIDINPPVAVVTLMATMFLFATAGQDDRSNVHVLINSLPVSRKEVVTARYAVSLGVPVAFVGLAALVVALMGRLPLRVALWQWAVAAAFLVVLVVVVLTVLPPLYFWGLRHNFWGLPDFISSLPPLPLSALVGAVLAVLLLGSWRLSLMLYQREDF